MSSFENSQFETAMLQPLPSNPTGIAVLAVSSVGIFVALVAVGFRIWARRLKKKRLNLGDYLIIVAWVSQESPAPESFMR